jgi:WD40 repeat protein
VAYADGAGSVVAALGNGSLTALDATNGAVAALFGQVNWGGDPLWTCLAVSPDGSRVASANSAENQVRVWDVRTGQNVQALPGRAADLAFDADGRRLAAAGQGGVMIWDWASGQARRPPIGRGKVSHLAFSRDGERLAGSVADGTVKVWDVDSGEEMVSLDGFGPDGAAGLAFSPDGRSLAIAKDKGVIVWGSSHDW